MTTKMIKYYKAISRVKLLHQQKINIHLRLTYNQLIAKHSTRHSTCKSRAASQRLEPRKFAIEPLLYHYASTWAVSLVLSTYTYLPALRNIHVCVAAWKTLANIRGRRNCQAPRTVIYLHNRTVRIYARLSINN